MSVLVMPMMVPAAHAIADRLASSESMKVLDIAAGHGAFGIALAHRSPKAEIVALDWKPVLALAEEHAKAPVCYATSCQLVLKDSILAHQTSAEAAGRIAQEAGVRTLVLSHFVPSDDPR